MRPSSICASWFRQDEWHFTLRALSQWKLSLPSYCCENGQGYTEGRLARLENPAGGTVHFVWWGVVWHLASYSATAVYRENLCGSKRLPTLWMEDNERKHTVDGKWWTKIHYCGRKMMNENTLCGWKMKKTKIRSVDEKWTKMHSGREYTICLDADVNVKRPLYFRPEQ